MNLRRCPICKSSINIKDPVKNQQLHALIEKFLIFSQNTHEIFKRPFHAAEDINPEILQEEKSILERQKKNFKKILVNSKFLIEKMEQNFEGNLLGKIDENASENSLEELVENLQNSEQEEEICSRKNQDDNNSETFTILLNAQEIPSANISVNKSDKKIRSENSSGSKNEDLGMKTQHSQKNNTIS